MKLFQQGDVLFHMSAIPKGKYTEITSTVIQEGEHTGHAHRIVMLRHDDKRSSGNWEFLENTDTKARFLRVGPGGIEISHEEHKTISIPEGEYRVEIVQEYDHFLEEARAVMD